MRSALDSEHNRPLVMGFWLKPRSLRKKLRGSNGDLRQREYDLGPVHTLPGKTPPA